VKREIPIRKKEIRAIGLQGLWNFELESGTRKFRFRKNEKANFVRHKVVKREIAKCSKYWPMVVTKGHIGGGERGASTC
jgi:hypothetical protein